ncbi:MAG: hypothetical protein LBG21_00025 [Campylobacteraceae bacterium]|nr:hypothetical protein [Campylobacteraceae bacterium]
MCLSVLYQILCFSMSFPHSHSVIPTHSASYPYIRHSYHYMSFPFSPYVIPAYLTPYPYIPFPPAIRRSHFPFMPFLRSPSVIPATERQAYEVSAYREGMRESTSILKKY